MGGGGGIRGVLFCLGLILESVLEFVFLLVVLGLLGRLDRDLCLFVLSGDFDLHLLPPGPLLPLPLLLLGLLLLLLLLGGEDLVFVGHPALGVRQVVLHADLPELLRVLVGPLPHDVLYHPGVRVALRHDLGHHFVPAWLQLDLAAHGAVLPVVHGSHTADVVTCFSVLLLEYEVEGKAVLAFESLEVTIIELRGNLVSA